MDDVLVIVFDALQSMAGAIVEGDRQLLICLSHQEMDLVSK